MLSVFFVPNRFCHLLILGNKLHGRQNLHSAPAEQQSQLIDLASLRLAFRLPLVHLRRVGRGSVMSRSRGRVCLKVAVILSALLLTFGCARPVDLPGTDSSLQPDQHQVPFHEADGRVQDVKGPVTASNDGTRESDLPFQDPQSLPAGTLLTVRLQNPIFADNTSANRGFSGIVDQPVMADGNRLVPVGALVSGHVESSRTSNLKRNRGYVRLVLESIQLSGTSLPVQTASLFVRENSMPVAAAPTVRLEKGHLLVFRLTEPLLIAVNQRTQAGH